MSGAAGARRRMDEFLPSRSREGRCAVAGGGGISGSPARARDAGRMIRKLPIIPTILVGLAVAVMIGLGIWQLQRKAEKDALLATYRAAEGKPPIGWPSMPLKEPLPLFRHATANCLQVVGFRTTAGQNQGRAPG